MCFSLFVKLYCEKKSEQKIYKRADRKKGQYKYVEHHLVC